MMILRIYFVVGWMLAAVCCALVSTSLGQPIHIKLNEDNKVDLHDTARKDPKEMDMILTDPSVRHFGRHTLCSHQQHFSDVLQTKMYFTSSFVSNLVKQLCRRPKLLDVWVAELYDMDEDGRISYFERHQYSV